VSIRCAAVVGALFAAVLATSGLACRALEKAATAKIPGLTEAEVENLTPVST
jgi:hypothetical protein